jgi:hypothetical protein
LQKKNSKIPFAGKCKLPNEGCPNAAELHALAQRVCSTCWSPAGKAKDKLGKCEVLLKIT